MTAELAAHADLQLQALALVDAFRDARVEDRNYLLERGDLADLMVGLILVTTQLTCSLASAWGMPPELLTATLRQIFAEQAAAL